MPYSAVSSFNSLYFNSFKCCQALGVFLKNETSVQIKFPARFFSFHYFTFQKDFCVYSAVS